MSRNKYPEETVKLIIEKALQLFIEKGYENTSIQDIINNLGGLSKGAIYHHFKSKEEIFEAVRKKIGEDNMAYYDTLLDDKGKNGYEKLESLLRSAYANPNNDAMIAMMERLLSEPKFFKSQIMDIYELVAPRYIQPVIEEGVRDGSIQTDYPKELAEAMTTLLNIWINPVIAKSDNEKDIRSKIEFFAVLLQGIGIDIFDEEAINEYVRLCSAMISRK